MGNKHSFRIEQRVSNKNHVTTLNYEGKQSYPGEKGESPTKNTYNYILTICNRLTGGSHKHKFALNGYSQEILLLKNKGDNMVTIITATGEFDYAI